MCCFLIQLDLGILTTNLSGHDLNLKIGIDFLLSNI